MAYINKDTESDAPWLAAGFTVTSLLFVSVPACLDPKWQITPLLKTGCSLLSVGFGVTSTFLYHRIRYNLYPQWLRNRDYQSSLEEDLAALTLRNELSKAAAIMVTQTKSELLEQFSNSSQQTLEATTESPKITPPQTTNDCVREVERLLNELTTDQQKQVLKNLENSLETPSDKGSSDFTPPTSTPQNCQNPLVENESGSEVGSDDSAVSNGHLEAIHNLIKGGMSMTKAITLISGAKSGRKFTKYSQAYKAKYGNEN